MLVGQLGTLGKKTDHAAGPLEMAANRAKTPWVKKELFLKV